MNKICSKCKQSKPITDYYTQLDKRYFSRGRTINASCKKCQADYRREWRHRNPEKEKARKVRFKKMSNIKYKYSYYKGACAKKRNLPFELTYEQFKEIVLTPCKYCGSNGVANGLDRIVNDIGYLETNVVSCCSTCNAMKSDMSLEDFLKKCEQITIFNNNKAVKQQRKRSAV